MLPNICGLCVIYFLNFYFLLCSNFFIRLSTQKRKGCRPLVTFHYFTWTHLAVKALSPPVLCFSDRATLCIMCVFFLTNVLINMSASYYTPLVWGKVVCREQPEGLTFGGSTGRQADGRTEGRGGMISLLPLLPVKCVIRFPSVKRRGALSIVCKGLPSFALPVFQ